MFGSKLYFESLVACCIFILANLTAETCTCKTANRGLSRVSWFEAQGHCSFNAWANQGTNPRPDGIKGPMRLMGEKNKLRGS